MKRTINLPDTQTYLDFKTVIRLQSCFRYLVSCFANVVLTCPVFLRLVTLLITFFIFIIIFFKKHIRAE